MTRACDRLILSGGLDCERLPESSEAMIQVSMIHLMLRRLAPTKQKRSQRFRYAA